MAGAESELVETAGLVTTENVGTHSSPGMVSDSDRLDGMGVDPVYSSEAIMTRSDIPSFVPMFIAFMLILCMWNAWTTLLDLITPFRTAFWPRSLLNAAVVVCGLGLSSMFRGPSSRSAALGNLLAGIGFWELVESSLEYVLGDASVSKLVFFLVMFMVACLAVVYLERWKNVRIVEGGFLSPL